MHMPALATQVMWSAFAVTWNLAFFDLISIRTEESLYLVCDFTAKVTSWGWSAAVQLAAASVPWAGYPTL